MTFSERTELNEKLRNAAHTRAIMHKVEKNGSKQLDHSRRWIAAGDGSRPERDCGWRWMKPDGSCLWMDRGLISIATGYGWMTVVDDTRWITGDGSRDTDDNQSPSLS
jgi:hypothetical protein